MQDYAAAHSANGVLRTCYDRKEKHIRYRAKQRTHVNKTLTKY